MLAAALASSLFESTAAHAQAGAPAPSAADGSTDAPAVPGADGTGAPGTTLGDPRRDISTRSNLQDEFRTFGALLDVGLPDGLMAGVSFRPLQWLRLHASAGTNAVSPGARAGVLVVPLGVGPSATLEAGHYFEGDANAVAGAFGGPEYRDNSMAEQVGYDFVNAHVGLEVGAERFTFFLHGGASYVRAELHHVNDVLGQSEGDTAITLHGNPRITAWLPSFKLGFVLHLV
jgi:hypothetical protein